MIENVKNSFSNVLMKVLKDEKTKYCLSNKTILISCPIEYYLPFILICKENFILENIEINGITFYEVKINYVSATKFNDTYMIISYEHCYDENKNISFLEFNNKFPSGNIINYEDYIKYEEEFYHFKTKFEIVDDCLVKIV